MLHKRSQHTGKSEDPTGLYILTLVIMTRLLAGSPHGTPSPHLASNCIARSPLTNHSMEDAFIPHLKQENQTHEKNRKSI